MKSLRDALDELPDEALVPVHWVRERLEEEPEPDGLDRLYTVPELAERFDRSEATIRTWLSSGRMRGFKVEGRAWRVRRNEVLAYEERQRNGAR